MTSAPSFKKTKPSSRPRIRNSFSQDRRRAPRVAPDPLQEILDGYVDPDRAGVNLVYYAALAANPADAAKLAGYLEYLEEIDPREYIRAEQMAYWIKFYNALTVKVVLDAYPGRVEGWRGAP